MKIKQNRNIAISTTCFIFFLRFQTSKHMRPRVACARSKKCQNSLGMCLHCSYSMKHSSQHLHNLVALFTLMSLSSRGLGCSLCACASYYFGGDVFILFSSGLAPSWEQVLSWLPASVHLARNPQGARVFQKPHHCMDVHKGKQEKQIDCHGMEQICCMCCCHSKQAVSDRAGPHWE